MEWLDKAIRKAGGYRAVSEAAGVSEFHLRNAGTGRRRLGKSSVAKLRPVLAGVPAKRWFEVLSGDVPVAHAADPATEPTHKPDPDGESAAGAAA
jgi:hypothetical protein